jgi:hypothetical protein
MITLPRLLSAIVMTTALGLTMSAPLPAQYVVGGFYSGGCGSSSWGVAVGATWVDPYPVYPAYGYAVPAYGWGPRPVARYGCAPAWRPVYRGYAGPRRWAGPPRHWGGGPRHWRR